MPPKKGGNKVNAKNEKAKKEKIIEDKTFGLKNKKGGKAQKVKIETYETPIIRRLKQRSKQPKKKLIMYWKI